MKQKDIAALVLVGGIAALVSFFIAGKVFQPPKGSTKVPQVSAINPSFPDIQNDPSYTVIFNTSALDPTQPVQIGNNNNGVPFR